MSYIVSGVFFWGGAGWLVDRALGTAPVGFVIGALLGNFAGIYLIYLRYAHTEGRTRR